MVGEGRGVGSSMTASKYRGESLLDVLDGGAPPVAADAPLKGVPVYVSNKKIITDYAWKSRKRMTTVGSTI